MIALSSTTAAAVALRAAESSWVVFLQVDVPGLTQGPIMIGGIRGWQLVDRLTQAAQNNPYTVRLIGLIETKLPEQDASTLANEFCAYQIHDWWFEPAAPLLNYIANEAQDAISILLAETHPGGLSDAPVNIESIAEILDVSVPTVRRMIKAGEIPFLKFGRIYRFVPNDVIASLKR